MDKHYRCFKIFEWCVISLLIFLCPIESYLSQAQAVDIESVGNTACQGVPCGWIGPKILINEFMVSPSVNDGSITGPGPNGGRAEWLELYNPDACNAVDISCYIIGNFTNEGGGGIRLPSNVIVPPSGFAYVLGVAAPPAPSASLVANGGNVVEVIVAPEINVPQICVTPASGFRVWLANAGGWFAIYDENGVPQDAVRWGVSNVAWLNGYPCAPQVSSCPSAQSLPSYNEIPLNRKSHASTANGFGHVGLSVRRLPDGGVWSGTGTPTIAACNGPCYNINVPTCTGTATVLSAPGIPPYTYQWNDPQNQTSPHAIGLCVGSYTVTVTSSDGIVSSGEVQIDFYSPPLALNSNNFCINEEPWVISGYSPSPNANQIYSISGPGVSNGIFNPASSGIGTHDVTFSLTDQSGCSNTIQTAFTVFPVPEVTLNTPGSVCITDEPFEININPSGAMLSGNGIIGTQFHPNLAGVGVHTITLTYTDPNACTDPATTVLTATITVNALTLPEFPNTPNYCQGASIPNLPSTSQNGINGSWSPVINNQSTSTYTFTPSPNQCAQSNTHIIEILPIATPVFNTFGPFCSGAPIPNLPVVSNNGITGAWSPEINNSSTTTYTFSPDSLVGNHSGGMLQCASNANTTIVINPILTPEFDDFGPYCAGSTINPLPTTSLNNVSGAWSPSMNNNVTTVYTFTPNPNVCAVSSSTEVIIVSGAVTLTCPSGQSALCYADISGAYTSIGEFQNAGGTLSPSTALLVSSSFTLSNEIGNGQSCNETVSRVYSFENSCGQTASCTQLIVINDTIPPLGLAPQNLTVQCIGDLPSPDIGALIGVSDNCTNTTITHLSDVSNGQSCPGLITRTYRIQDACGNFTNVTQTITILDTIAPTGTAPADIWVQCSDDVPLPNVNLVSNVSDNCQLAPTVSFLSDISSGSCPEIITRTYRVEDACGNFTDLIQTITVWDTIAPSGTAPSNLLLNCISELDVPNINLVTGVNDNCAVPVISHLSDLSSGICPEIITRTYRIEDACANATDVVQLITIFDTIPPTATAPSNIVVSCPADIPSPDVNSVTNVADNCQIATVSHYSDVSDGNSCNFEIITRTYRIVDACGNENFVSQLISIELFTPTATLSTSNPTTCQGSDGFITLSNLNINVLYSISYNNETVITQSSTNGQIVLANLSAGAYSNFVISYVNCSSCAQILDTTIVLQDPANPVISAGDDISFCDGNSFFIQAANPQNAVVFWSDNIPDGSLVQPSVGINTYTVTAILNNCISTDDLVVIVHPLPSVSAGDDFTVCQGEELVLSGSGAQTYIWTHNVIDGVPFVQTVNTQTYLVTGTDSLGCINQATVQVHLLENPQPSFITNGFESCEKPFSVLFSNTSTQEIVSCNWIFNNNTTIQNSCLETEVTFETEGCFSVSLSVVYSNGCSNLVFQDSVVCVYPTPSAQFFATPSIQEVNSDIFFFNATQGENEYFWFFNEEDPAIQSKDVIYQFEESGEFEIILVAINEFGCPDTTSQRIMINNPILFFVPNAFTPDGDQFNNEFKPIMATGFDPYNYQLTIFSRWGETLFVSKNANFGWTGTYGGKLAPEGIYIWQIEVKDENGISEIHRGHVSLLR